MNIGFAMLEKYEIEKPGDIILPGVPSRRPTTAAVDAVLKPAKVTPVRTA